MARHDEVKELIDAGRDREAAERGAVTVTVAVDAENDEGATEPGHQLDP